MAIYEHIQIDEAITKLESIEEYEKCDNLLQLKNAILNKDVEAYIKLAFDVKSLEKTGFLSKNMTIKEIENRVNLFFGYKEIFEFSKVNGFFSVLAKSSEEI